MSLDFILGTLFGFGTFALVMITMQHALTKSIEHHTDLMNRFQDELAGIGRGGKDPLK